MALNSYEASELPSGPTGGKRRFLSGYISLEVFWISLAIVITGYIALCYLVLPLGENHVVTELENILYSVPL
jgi:hypothetical protein